MYVYIYMFIDVCIYICIYIYIIIYVLCTMRHIAHTHTYVRTYLHTFIQSYRHACIRTYTHRYIHTHTHTNACLNTDACTVFMWLSKQCLCICQFRASFYIPSSTTAPTSMAVQIRKQVNLCAHMQIHLLDPGPKP